MSQAAGTIFLIPTDLGGESIGRIWPADNLQMIRHLRHFIVENERSARRFLRKAGYDIPFEEVSMHLLNKHTKAGEISGYLHACLAGHDMGILSEAGTPCVADPGQNIVQIAHRRGLKVVPMVGPSSMIMALMASGFNGQHFLFHGYLPISKHERIRAIKNMERAAYSHDQTQLFMETPYRNNQLMEDLVKTCDPATLICVACDITLASEYIRTLPTKEWKKNMPDLHKRPGIFLLYHP